MHHTAAPYDDSWLWAGGGGREERAALSHAELFPEPWIDAEALSHAGVAPGANFGELLSKALRMQLSGELSSQADALAWLAERA